MITSEYQILDLFIIFHAIPSQWQGEHVTDEERRPVGARLTVLVVLAVIALVIMMDPVDVGNMSHMMMNTQ